MDSNKIYAVVNKLPENNRLAILELVSVKVETDMDKVLDKLDFIGAKLDSRLDAMESKFDAKLDTMESKFDAKLDAMESKFDAKFDAMESKFDVKFDAMEYKLDAMEYKFDSKIGAQDKTIANLKWFIISVVGIVGLAVKLIPLN